MSQPAKPSCTQKSLNFRQAAFLSETAIGHIPVCLKSDAEYVSDTSVLERLQSSDVFTFERPGFCTMQKCFDHRRPEDSYFVFERYLLSSVQGSSIFVECFGCRFDTRVDFGFEFRSVAEVSSKILEFRDVFNLLSSQLYLRDRRITAAIGRQNFRFFLADF